MFSLFFIFRLFQLIQRMPVHAEGHRKHDNLHHKLSPDHTIQTNRKIHQDQQRNIEEPLSAECKDCGLRPFPHGLKSITDQKIHRSQRHSQTGNTKKSGSQRACLRLRNEQMQNLRSKNCKTGNKTCGHDQSRFPRKIRNLPHPLIITGSIVISHQRHKALT